MLKDNYVIVTLPDQRSGDLSAIGLAPSASPTIEVAELAPADLQDLQRDRRKRLAPSMPWTLIEPVAVEPVAEARALKEEGPVTWGITAVGAASSPYDGSGIVVAVLDTGIDLTHPAFAGVPIERRNFTAESDEDVKGHGTHCAATFFGQDVGGTRIGVARNVARALVGKVLGRGASTQGLIEAINWAVSSGAHIISLSLGIDFPGYVAQLITVDGLEPEPATSLALEAYRKNVDLFSDCCQFALSQRRAFGSGIVFVAAAGYASRRPRYTIAKVPPAAAKDIVSVAALAQGAGGCTVAEFSNTEADISAPGVGILSAKAGGGLVALSGTSMAAPHVAGVAALWAQKQLAADGQISSARLAAQLIASGTKALLAAGHRMPESVGAGLAQAPQE